MRRGALRRAVRVAAMIVASAPFATRLAFAQVASSAPPGGVQPELARVEPWPAGLSNGLEELERRIAAGDHAGVRDLVRRLEAPDALARRRAEWIAAGGWRASALRAIDPAIELLRWRPRAAAIAGELALVDGVAALGLEQWEEAQAAFLLARAEGGGATRLEAIDALADLELAAAEALRPGPDGSAPAAAQVATPPGGANPNAPPSAADPAEDPIAKARAAYLVARARLVERLRLERHDADARANLELVQRRLEELRRLEDQRRREEEQQRREQQEQQDKEKDKEKDEQERQPEDQQGQDQQEQPEEEQQDERQPSEADESKADDQAPKPAAAMSKEEAQKLLDKLKELEEKGEELRATLLKDRRQKVDKDW